MADLSGLALIQILAEDPQYSNEDREKMFYNIKSELQKIPALFVSLYRLSPRQFDELLQLIQPRLTRFRNPGLDLSITLRYLCSKYDINKYLLLFGVDNRHTVKIVREVCTAIVNGLRPMVLPSLIEGHLEQSAVSFKKHWSFPNCVAAIDGRSIPFQTHKNGETKYCKLQLLAACDAYSRFTEYLLSEKNGKYVEDTFLKSPYPRFVEEARVEFHPEMKCDTPFVLVAGELDVSKKTIMRPFSENTVDIGKAIFNYQHARAMNAADTAFGILINQWEIFQSPMIGDFSEVSGRITCLLLLHNWLINQEKELPPTSKVYMPRCLFHDEDEEGIYVEGCWAKNSSTKSAKRLTSSNKKIKIERAGRRIRDKFVEYFLKESATPSPVTDHTERTPEETPSGDTAQKSGIADRT